MKTHLQTVRRTGWTVLLVVSAWLLLGPGERKVNAQAELPQLQHGGWHFWLNGSQQEIAGRARQALIETGLVLDADDGFTSRWANVARGPGIYAGVATIAEGPNDSLVDDQAQRVLVSITLVALPEKFPEAQRHREFIREYIQSGQRPGGPSPGGAGVTALGTSKAVYTLPEEVVVVWRGTPAADDSWSIAPVGWTDGTSKVGGPTNGVTDGQVSVNAVYHLGAGEFEVRLHHADGQVYARHRFQVVQP